MFAEEWDRKLRRKRNLNTTYMDLSILTLKFKKIYDTVFKNFKLVFDTPHILELLNVIRNV